MFDYDRLKGFEWGAGNVRKNLDKRDVGQSEAEQVFFNAPLVLAVDPEHGGTEVHHHALAQTDAGRRLHITFTLRAAETKIRVLSARDMSRKERLVYEQKA